MSREEQEKWLKDNEKLIWKVVHKYQDSFDPKIYEEEDLFQICSMKMIEAGFDLYDQSKGYKLSTWATRLMEQSLTGEIKKNSQKKRCAEVVSLDAIDEENDNAGSAVSSIISGMYADLGVDIADKLCDEEQMKIIYDSLGVLTPEERFVVQHLTGIGIDEEKRMTQAEIAKALDQSQGLISLIYKRSRLKMMGEIKAKMGNEAVIGKKYESKNL